jgi:hypothetical protein
VRRVGARRERTAPRPPRERAINRAAVEVTLDLGHSVGDASEAKNRLPLRHGEGAKRRRLQLDRKNAGGVRAAIAVSVLRYGVSVVQVAPMIYATSH